MEAHLKIIGSILIGLAFLHAGFPRQFHWKTELASLSLLNRQLMYVHTFFIALLVFLLGIFCMVSAKDIVHTPLGHTLALGLGIFWFMRLLCQFFVYSPELWKGKRFETAVHILFSVFWTYTSGVFFWIYWVEDLLL